MHRIKPNHIHNTALLFILFTPFTVLFYASYVFNPANAGNFYLYILQIIADIIAIVTVTTLWLTILLDLIQPDYHKRKLVYSKEWVEKNNLKIDVLIPVSSEPYEIIEETVVNAVSMDYPHKVYMLDDGGSAELKVLCAKLGVVYLSRPKNKKKFAKSGNLNYGLHLCSGDFFAVFDADHVPKKTFLIELLPFFENEKVALVQTPQHYKNTHNFIAEGTAKAQEIFYKYVQPAKNSYNATFCVGTNMIYRRSAIDKIGGIPLLNHSEDIWTTIILHEEGLESVFYNKILAEGRAPETISAFFRQQNRWARGGFSLFFTHNPLFLPNLTIDQKLQYFFSNIHYFSGFAILIYLLLPIIYLLFGIHPMDVLHNNGWLIHYLPYFLTVYFLPVFLLKEFKLSTISVSLASFAPYLKAFISVIMKNNYTWIPTESKNISFNFIMLQIWPHLFILVLSLLAILVGWYNPIDFYTTFITTVWVFINAYLLFEFIKNGILAGEKKN